MSFFSFYVENGKHVSDWNVVDNIFEFNPFAKSKLIFRVQKYTIPDIISWLFIQYKMEPIV